ncbi:MAG: type II toxin-antitoxin system RelB/DinJ family antitoxin [Elusimicrobiota bacterium]|nr:type II toxin-antitoxin system RelB/DinJ family antitoxin [Elusimicrobiota bacterium]
MLQLSVKINKDLEKKANIVFNEQGLSIDDAVKLFVIKTIEQRKMPFDISAQDNHQKLAKVIDNKNPIYSETNMKVLKKSIMQFAEGKGRFISKKELKSMAK